MGVFPKKCFSLGEANEKRDYIECRLLSEHEEEVLEEEDPEASELAQETEDQEQIEEVFEKTVQGEAAPQKLKEFKISNLFKKKPE